MSLCFATSRALQVMEWKPTCLILDRQPQRASLRWSVCSVIRFSLAWA